MKLLGLQKWQLYILQLMSDHRIHFFSPVFAWIPVSSFPTSTLPCLYQLYSALLTYPQTILFSLAIHIHNRVCISLHTHGIMNSGLRHCRQILSCLSQQGRPMESQTGTNISVHLCACQPPNSLCETSNLQITFFSVESYS